MKTPAAFLLAVMSLPFWVGAQDITLLPRQTTTSAPAAPGTPAVAEVPGHLPDGIAMLNGVVYLVRGGKAMRVDKEITLRVTPKGSVTDFDGRIWVVPPGQLVTMDGRTVAIADSVLDTRAAEQAARPSSEGARNYSGLAPAGSGEPSASRGTASAQATGGSQAQGAGTSGSGGARLRTGQGGGGGGLLPLGGVLPVPLANDLNFIPNTQIPGTDSNSDVTNRSNLQGTGSNVNAGTSVTAPPTTTNPGARPPAGAQGQGATGAANPGTQTNPNAPASTGTQGATNQQRAVNNPNARPAGTATQQGGTRPGTGGTTTSGGTSGGTGGTSSGGTGTSTGGTIR